MTHLVDDRTEREVKVTRTNVTGAVLFHRLPREFVQLFYHARELRYGQQPNYQFLKGLFRSRASALGVQLDAPFNPHVTSTGFMELVTSPWPTIVQNSGFDDTNKTTEMTTKWDLTGMDIFLSGCFKAGCQSKTYLGMRIRWSKGRWMLLLIHLLLPKISRCLPLKKS